VILKFIDAGSYVEKYENNELEGVVYGDVPEALEKWHALGIKVLPISIFQHLSI
jgi:methylthioribulose 1-phosphate dehydratase/enolase-phosphatase E1